ACHGSASATTCRSAIRTAMSLPSPCGTATTPAGRCRQPSSTPTAAGPIPCARSPTKPSWPVPERRTSPAPPIVSGAPCRRHEQYCERASRGKAMSDLATAVLGRTGIPVTTLGFGAMELRGAGAMRGREVDDDTAADMLRAVLDAGINYIDTSPDYGRSEER